MPSSWLSTHARRVLATKPNKQSFPTAVTGLASSSAMSMASTRCIELAGLDVKMSLQWPYLAGIRLHTASLMTQHGQHGPVRSENAELQLSTDLLCL